MAKESSAAVLRHVQTIFRGGSSSALTDGQLIDRYSSGDPDAAEAAFAALVERHAGMVFGLCKAVLRDPHDAEDALQATFLVLARRARSIREPGSVAGWLARVARRVAIRAKARSAARRAREREAAEREARRLMGAPANAFAELYEEIDRLPERLRGPVVLCDLEGLSYEQAAGQLLVPVGTVRSRLSRARGRLADRLRRRGIAPCAVAAGLAPPAATTEAIIRAAIDLAAGRAVAGPISAESVRLASSHIRSGLMVRIGMIATALVSAGLVALGAGMRTTPREAVAAEAPMPTRAIADKPAPAGKMVFARVVDAQGKPVAGQDVYVVDGRGRPRSFKTDAAGLVRVPDDGDEVRRQLAVVAIPDEKTIGWATVGRDDDRATGKEDDPLTLSLEPRDSPITGTVVDRGGRPIAGVKVRLEQMRDETNGWLLAHGVTFPGWPIVGVSDDRGRYSIPLPRGASGFMWFHHRRYVGPGTAFKADRTPLGPTTLEPAGGIVGVVTEAATGRPVAGAIIGAQTLEHRPGRVLNGGWGEATTDDRGRFEIGGLAAGVYNLLFVRAPEGRRTMIASAVEGVRVKVDQDARADLTAIDPHRRNLRGTVVDATTKAPLAGVSVGYYGTGRPRSGAAVMSTQTDAAGRFELTVPPGPSYVYVMDGGRVTHSSSRDVDVPEARDSEPVQLLAGPMEPLSRPVAKAGVAGAPQPGAAAKGIVMQRLQREPEKPEGPGTILTGRVVDPAGTPVPGVTVTYNTRQLFIQTATDREGEFIMEGLPEGDQKIELSKEGYRTAIELARENAGEGVTILIPRPGADRKPAPPPPNLPADLRFLDLQPVANEPLDQGPLPNGDDLAELPLGVRKLGGMWYSVGPKMSHLRASVQARLPKSAEGIKVGSRCVRLYILHGTQYEVMPGTTIGHYTVHYADGSSEEIPIVYGEDLSVWKTWNGGPGKTTRAQVAWKGKNQQIELNPEAYVFLFERVWTNPHPDRVVESIDFESSVTDCSPFLIAVTAETR